MDRSDTITLEGLVPAGAAEAGEGMTTRDLSFMHDLGINPSTSMCLELLYCSIGKGTKGKYDPKANEDQSAGVGSRQKERIRVQIRPHDAAGRLHGRLR